MTPVPPIAQRPLGPVLGVLPSDWGVDGARSRWILGIPFGTSGVVGNNSIERSWRGADGARRAVLYPNSLVAGCVVGRFGAESPAAREFVSKVQVVVRRRQGRIEGATLPGQFECAREHGDAEQDDSCSPCDDLRIHDPVRPSMEHLDGLRLIALRTAEEAAGLLACLSLIGAGAGPARLCARDCAAMTAV